uniref:Rho-GAP domain-containing protein n=1 Tax=Opuntia streptacantha TaxID=393608 RepID=A0A7C9CTL6_OPUST
MPYSSIALNLLQSLNLPSIESPQVTLDHVVRDLLPEFNKLLVRQVLSDFVLQAQIAENLASPRTANTMNILKRVFDPFFIRDFHPTNTHTFDVQPTNLGRL